jgi:hypothetical protein
VLKANRKVKFYNRRQLRRNINNGQSQYKPRHFQNNPHNHLLYNPTIQTTTIQLYKQQQFNKCNQFEYNISITSQQSLTYLTKTSQTSRSQQTTSTTTSHNHKLFCCVSLLSATPAKCHNHIYSNNTYSNSTRISRQPPQPPKRPPFLEQITPPDILEHIHKVSLC